MRARECLLQFQRGRVWTNVAYDEQKRTFPIECCKEMEWFSSVFLLFLLLLR